MRSYLENIRHGIRAIANAIPTVLFIILGLTQIARSEVVVSGLADFVFANYEDVEKDLTNVTFGTLDAFHSQRTRLFFDAAVTEDVSGFAQIMIDNGKIVLYGAYARFEHIAGEHVNAHVGFIPNTVGAWGPRTYSNVNPLIGAPLLWVHHSSYNPGSPDTVRNADQLLARASNRNQFGLPVLYDACWNTGFELFGEIHKFSYSIAALSGSVTKPTIAQEKDVPQFTTHLTYSFSPGFVVGASGFYGPYLYEEALNDSLPTGKESIDYMNYGVGAELYLAHHYLEINGEVFTTTWEHPYVNKLTATSGYLEAKYKLTVGWYLAGRFGFYEPGKIADSSGNQVKWDYPVKRYEIGVGYKPNRATTIKLVTQMNRFDINDSYDTDIYATQVSVAF